MLRVYKYVCIVRRLKPDWETRLLWRIVKDTFWIDCLIIYSFYENIFVDTYESTNTIIIKQNSTQKSFLVSNNQFWLFRIYYYSRAESTLQMNNHHNHQQSSSTIITTKSISMEGTSKNYTKKVHCVCKHKRGWIEKKIVVYPPWRIIYRPRSLPSTTNHDLLPGPQKS